MDFRRIKIITTVPLTHADIVREALGVAGAGQIGEYNFCSFSYKGEGRFVPSSAAHPHIGESGKLEVVEEERIEAVCDRTIAKQVISALRQAHPYEEAIVEIVPLINEDQL